MQRTVTRKGVLAIADSAYVSRLGAPPAHASHAGIPVLAILAFVARWGISHGLRWIGRAQVKKAAKSFLLNEIKADRWTHILHPKHQWSVVGARSREDVAELMSRAFADGAHRALGGGGMQAVWRFGGRDVVVRYSQATGKIADGWVAW